jgi:hypothetical protein
MKNFDGLAVCTGLPTLGKYYYYVAQCSEGYICRPVSIIPAAHQFCSGGDNIWICY